MDAPALRITELTKYYGPVIGVETLSLDVPAGSVFGFLGANGAGKTTTIRLLLDLLRPTSGSASILGFDCRRQSLEVRRRVGYLPSEMPFYADQTGAGYLKFLSALGEQPVSSARLELLFRRFDMSDLDLGRRMRDYSHGMKRKIGIVQALMADAPVLILDEPTSGLDPLMIEAFCETIDELSRSGRTTIFLSSHVLSEVDRVCDRIALVRNGRLVAVRTMSELRAATPRRVTVLFSQPVDASVALSPDLTIVTREPLRWVIEARGPIGGLVAGLASLPVADISIAAFGLEEAILHLFEDRAC
ncbi:MAG TPA: ABC transporter ATP-binding protein [Vicinamibacterales bacterium]|nr:ABC transporter ATP-binding protein [Vicinamibacterales bacterium]